MSDNKYAIVALGQRGIVVSVTRQMTITEKVLARIQTSQDLEEQKASALARRRTATDWRLLADELWDNKDWPGLINHSLRWTQAFPEDALAWLQLGVAYFESGQYDEAIEAYKEALRNSNTAYLWNKLGLAYNDSGQFDEAIEAYKEAIRIYPEYADAWFHLGVTYRQSNQTDQVMEVYKLLKTLDVAKADEFYMKVVSPR